MQTRTSSTSRFATVHARAREIRSEQNEKPRYEKGRLAKVGDPARAKRGLTLRQRRYIRARMRGLYQFKAALEAGYSESVAYTASWKIERKPAVRAALDRFMRRDGLDDWSLMGAGETDGGTLPKHGRKRRRKAPMNDAQLVGIIMSDEDYFRLALRASYGDPEACAIIKAVQERIRIRAEAAREAWGYGKSGDATDRAAARIDPISEPDAKMSEPSGARTLSTGFEAGLIPPDDLAEWLDTHVAIPSHLE